MDLVTICNRALSVIGTRSSIASMTEASPEAQACALHFEPSCRGMLRLAPWSFARATVQGALIAAAPGTAENPNGTAPLPLVPICGANPAGATPTQIVSWQYEYAWPWDCVRLRQVRYPFDQPQSPGAVVPLWPGVVNASNLFAGSPGNRVPYQIALDMDAIGNRIKVVLSNIENALIVYTAYVNDPNLWDDEFSEAFVYALASHLVGALIGDKQMDKDLWAKAQALATQARVVDGNEQSVSPNHTPDWIMARGGGAIAETSSCPMDDDCGYMGPA
ncbi:MAG: hypothetical protein P4L43_16475 [Syntrophobacteraceae bacterium]|nr:hypothetical protein [Syntrophobacteraceae bacterium]